MNEGAYSRLAGNGMFGRGKFLCSLCGDLGKACYRYWMRPLHQWIYMVIPCHSCHRTEFNLESKKYPSLEISERWVSIPIGQQLDVLSRPHAEEHVEPLSEPVDDSSEDE